MEQLEIEEYKFLRQEHENNRRFIFERPLLIAGVAFAGASRGLDGWTMELLFLSFLLLLFFNLWFTFNRAESSARIVGYLQVVHEPGPSGVRWIGWENALREYRHWRFANGDSSRTRAEPEQFQQTDSTRFYEYIYLFHVVFAVLGAVFALTISLKSALSFSSSYARNNSIIISAVSLVALIAFLVKCRNFRPQKVLQNIEVERRAWNEVFRWLREREIRSDAHPKS